MPLRFPLLPKVVAEILNISLSLFFLCSAAGERGLSKKKNGKRTRATGGKKKKKKQSLVVPSSSLPSSPGVHRPCLSFFSFSFPLSPPLQRKDGRRSPPSELHDACDPPRRRGAGSGRQGEARCEVGFFKRRRGNIGDDDELMVGGNDDDGATKRQTSRSRSHPLSLPFSLCSL